MGRQPLGLGGRVQAGDTMIYLHPSLIEELKRAMEAQENKQ